MSGNFGLVFHLWDFAGEPGTLLDRALGEVGFDHLTVPVVTGSMEQFRLDPVHPPHIFVTEGGWHFTPRLDSYQGGTIRPRAARWFGKRDVLGRLREYADERNVELVFRVDPRAVTSLPEHEPHLRARNAWGDENPSAGVCVLNADARELLRGTLADLMRYEPAGFQLVNWMADLAVERGRTRQFQWHPWLQRLLDICFCPACRQAAAVAGVDPDQAARSVRVHVERMIADPENSDDAGQLDEDGVLRSYLDVRRRDTLTWLARLAETHDRHRRYMLVDHWFSNEHWSEAETAFADLPDSAFVQVFRSLTLALSDFDFQQSVFGPAAGRGINSLGLVLPVWYPFVRQADQLVRTVSEAMRAGVALLDFEGLEDAPGEALNWLRQAVRFARRG